MIEQYFALFQADFGQWFFSQILTDGFVSQRSAWGPDLMWCGAAREYKPDHTPCRLVPVSLLHDDTRTIKADTKAGNEAVKRFAANKAFKPWHLYQAVWVKITAHANFNEFKKRCKARTHSNYFNVTDCIFAAQPAAPLRKDVRLKNGDSTH
jgi:hypothetical protein